ncbi:MAG: HTH-type transcriptional repressor FabR [Bdellovibrionales bacterium]|nr:HTH-type transcriptional repressor FabR [Bdellovibrionales bacterium]
MAERIDQKQKTRRKLIETTLKLSAERGFSSLSLREVAKSAGITPAAFYRHFRDMEDLGLTLIDEVGLGLRQILREARRTVDSRESSVRSTIESFINYIAENSNLFRVLQGERQGATPAFRRALYSEFGRFIEEIADDIERRAANLKQTIYDSGLAAEAIVAVAFTVGSEALDLPKHRREELTERLIKEVRMILRGALTADSNPKDKKSSLRKN